MKVLLLGAAFAALATSSAAAQTGQRVAVGAQVGTTGLGAEVQYQATPTVTLRGAADIFSYEDDFETDDFNYQGRAEFTTGSVFADLHPMNSPLFVSGGVFFGKRMVEVSATTSANQTIGGQVFTPAQFGTLNGQADFGGAAPFLGLGWNNTFRTRGPIGFKIMAGAAFGGDPEVTLSRDGGIPFPAPVQAAFDAERAQEEEDLEQELEDFKVMPVVQVGLTYRF